MNKKSVWKAIGTIKDPVVRAYLEDAVQGQVEVERLTARANQSALNYQQKCRDVEELENSVERLTVENAKLKESALDPVELAKVAIALKENNTLKAELKEEVSRRYQAECNYDHAVTDRDNLQEQLAHGEAEK